MLPALRRLFLVPASVARRTLGVSPVSRMLLLGIGVVSVLAAFLRERRLEGELRRPGALGGFCCCDVIGLAGVGEALLVSGWRLILANGVESLFLRVGALEGVEVNLGRVACALGVVLAHAEEAGDLGDHELAALGKDEVRGLDLVEGHVLEGVQEALLARHVFARDERPQQAKETLEALRVHLVLVAARRRVGRGRARQRVTPPLAGRTQSLGIVPLKLVIAQLDRVCTLLLFVARFARLSHLKLAERAKNHQRANEMLVTQPRRPALYETTFKDVLVAGLHPLEESPRDHLLLALLPVIASDRHRKGQLEVGNPGLSLSVVLQAAGHMALPTRLILLL